MTKIEQLDSVLHDVGEIANELRAVHTKIKEACDEWDSYYKRNLGKPDAAEYALENLLAAVVMALDEEWYKK